MRESIDDKADIMSFSKPTPMEYLAAFASAGLGLVKDPRRIPDVVKTEIRSRGTSYAGSLELLLSSGVCLSTTYVFISELSPTFRSLSLGVLTAAELLWFGSHVAAAIPIPAVREQTEKTSPSSQERPKDRFVHSSQILVTQGFSALSENQAKMIRGGLLKANAVLDAAASISYAAAGIMLNDWWMPAATVWYAVADKIHFSGRQGEDVPFPHFEKGTPLSERKDGYAHYIKELFKNNPNLRAESISFPGVMISLIGLLPILPPAQMAVFFVGYGAASIIRGASIAIQETDEEKADASTRPPAGKISERIRAVFSR